MTMRSWRSSFSASLPLLPAAFSCLELVDEIDQVEEPPSGARADDSGSDGDAEMSFARAGTADEDGVALGVQEGAGGQFAHLALVDRRI